MLKMKKNHTIFLITLIFNLCLSNLNSFSFFDSRVLIQAAEQNTSKNFLDQGNGGFPDKKEVKRKKVGKKKKVKKKEKNAKKYQKKKAQKRKKIASSEKGEFRSYVVNMRTKKFHLPSCRTIRRMSNKNRMDVEQTKEELINSGYSTCKVCYP